MRRRTISSSSIITEGDDDVRGGSGPDRIYAETGLDDLTGGTGSDYLNTKDATSGDIVDGGPEPDNCVTDPDDTKASCP